jgi:hypothetical protein
MHHKLIFDMGICATLGSACFYYHYRFALRRPTSWDECVPLAEDVPKDVYDNSRHNRPNPILASSSAYRGPALRMAGYTQAEGVCC